MNNTTEIPEGGNTTAEDSNNSTAHAPVTNTTAPGLDAGEVVGIVVGVSCAVILVALIIILIMRRRRRKKKLPPILPDPFARPSIGLSELSRSNSSPESQDDFRSISSDPHISQKVERFPSVISKTISNAEPLEWVVQKPVIHSPTDFTDDEAVPYFQMHPVPISNSPPSPSIMSDQDYIEHMPLPPPCVSPGGYINVKPDKPHPSPQNPGRSRKSTQDADGSDEDEHGNYENVAEVVSTLKNVDFPGQTLRDEANDVSRGSHFSSSSSDSSRSSRSNSRYTNVRPAVPDDRRTQSGTTEPHLSGSSSDSDVSDFLDNDGHPTYYINVDKCTKQDLRNVKKSESSKLASLDQTSKLADPDKTSKHANLDQTSKLGDLDKTSKHANLDQTSKLGDPDKTSKHANLDQTSKLGGPDKTSKHANLDQTSKPGGPDKTSKHANLDQTSKLASLDKTSEDRSGTKPKAPAVLPKPNPPQQPSSSNSAVNSNTHISATRSDLTEHSRANVKQSRTGDRNPKLSLPSEGLGATDNIADENIREFNETKDKISVPQHPKKTPKPKLLSVSTGNLTHSNTTNTQSTLSSSQSAIAKNVLNGNTNKIHKMAVQRPELPTGASRSPLEKTKFANSSNSESVINEIRSKLKKVN